MSGGGKRPVRVRFAPSPTGYLHLGNARAAVLNWLFARKEGGHFLLRIDDTDRERCEERYVEAIRRDLAWLGIDWDEEARQSARLERYRAAAETLKAAGRLYPCYETPEELALKRRMQRARGLPPVYDRAALALDAAARARLEAEGRRPHWRFRLDTDARVVWEDRIRGRQEVDPASLSDPVLIRADGSFLYLLPSTVDDIDFGISHVIRGEDHVTNTGEQIQIFTALGATPPQFAHYPLLRAKDGGKYSKRAGSSSLAALREEADLEPETVLSFLARLGTADPIEPVLDPAPLIAGFDFARFSRAGASVDADALDQLNARVLHLMDYERVKERPLMAGLGADFWVAVRPNLTHFGEVAIWRRVIEGPIEPLIEEDDRGFCATAAGLLPGAIDAGTWKSWTTALKDATGRKGRALYRPLRRALTGREEGPEMAALLPLIGAARARKRLLGESA